MNAKFIKFLVIALVVNTVLFTLAKLSNIPVWKVVLAEVIVFFLWVAWKAWRSPAQQLANQAANMGWIYVGVARDEDGMRDSLLERKGIVARISFKKKCVFIVKPFEEGPFRDFVEVERHLVEIGE